MMPSPGKLAAAGDCPGSAAGRLQAAGKHMSVQNPHRPKLLPVGQGLEPCTLRRQGIADAERHGTEPAGWCHCPAGTFRVIRQII